MSSVDNIFYHNIMHWLCVVTTFKNTGLRNLDDVMWCRFTTENDGDDATHASSFTHNKVKKMQGQAQRVLEKNHTTNQHPMHWLRTLTMALLSVTQVLVGGHLTSISTCTDPAEPGNITF